MLSRGAGRHRRDGSTFGAKGHGQFLRRGLSQYLHAQADMDIGVVLQTNPPASTWSTSAGAAESLGFSHVWTFDSHLLWQEPFVIYSQILAATRKVIVGPMVTNPAPATGPSPRRCSPPSTRCTATARSAASAAATPPCGSPTARRRPWPSCASPST